MYTLDEANLHSPRNTSPFYSVPNDDAREFGREAIIAELENHAAAARANRRRAFRRLLRKLWAKFPTVGISSWAKSVRTAG